MRHILVTLFLLIALPLVSGAGDFDWLVRDFARESGVQPLHIPLFGLVRFAVSAFRPAGASELNLAVFEHAHFDPERFKELADHAVGPSWRPMIHVRSSDGETTEVYAQTDAQRLRLLIATLDPQLSSKCGSSHRS